jgi:hypothetical protein
MHTKIFGSIQGLIFHDGHFSEEPLVQINLGLFKISNDYKFRDDNLVSEKVESWLGMSGMEADVPFLYFDGNLDQYLNDTSPANLRNYTEKLINFIGVALFTFWFVKDNCISMENLYTDHKFGFRSQRVSISLNFNSAGKLEGTLFNESEIAEYKTVLPVILEHFKDQYRSANYIVNHSENLIDYRNINRLQRAFHFLDDARKSFIISKKVTYYIALLESLFTTSNTELTHKVSERAAFFVGKSVEEKLSIYKIVKNGYNVRSRYMHGDSINMDRLSLNKTSLDLDNLVRSIFLKIMINGYKIFTELVDSEGDKKTFDKYFDHLAFGIELSEGFYTLKSSDSKRKSS